MLLKFYFAAKHSIIPATEAWCLTEDIIKTLLAHYIFRNFIFNSELPKSKSGQDFPNTISGE